MTGLPDFNYPAFRRAAAALLAQGYVVLNPVDAEQHNDTGKPQRWDWYMRHALRMVLEAQALALLPGWGQSKGAILEVQVAAALDLPIKPLDDWLEPVSGSARGLQPVDEVASLGVAEP
jgi:hypothetical protein